MKTPYRAVLGTAVEHFWLFNFKIFLVVAALRIKLSEHKVSDVVLKEIEQRLQIENETLVSLGDGHTCYVTFKSRRDLSVLDFSCQRADTEETIKR